MLRLILAALSIWSFFLCMQPVAAASFSLVYTGQLGGELEPCACTQDSDLGGIRRLASAVDGLRADNGDLVLVSVGGLLGTTQPAHQVTNRFILQGIAALEYDAISLQWHDLIYGFDALAAEPLPWVATNWSQSSVGTKQQALVTSVRIIEFDSLRVGFLNWLGPNPSQEHDHLATQGRVQSDTQELENQLTALKAKSAFTIVAVNDAGHSLINLPLALIDVLLLSSSDEEYLSPERIGQTWVLRAGTRGQRLGHLTFSSDGVGGWKLKSHDVIKLDSAVPDAKRLDTWYEQYELALVEDYRAREKLAKKIRSDGHYTGDKMCGLCHSNQKAQWKITEHARAYQSLQAASKQFDANCVVCHVVGFGEPGGFYSAQAEPDLRNVGCEACHGPGKSHQASGGTMQTSRVTMSACRSCHTREHSPTFNPDEYWPRVVHRSSSERK